MRFYPSFHLPVRPSVCPSVCLLLILTQYFAANCTINRSMGQRDEIINIWGQEVTSQRSHDASILTLLRRFCFINHLLTYLLTYIWRPGKGIISRPLRLSRFLSRIDGAVCPSVHHITSRYHVNTDAHRRTWFSPQVAQWL